MTTILCDFSLIFCKNCSFLKNQCNDPIFAEFNSTYFESKTPFFADFRRKCFKNHNIGNWSLKRYYVFFCRKPSCRMKSCRTTYCRKRRKQQNVENQVVEHSTKCRTYYKMSKLQFFEILSSNKHHWAQNGHLTSINTPLRGCLSLKKNSPIGGGGQARDSFDNM
jgi:hypothetical protein